MGPAPVEAAPSSPPSSPRLTLARGFYWGVVALLYLVVASAVLDSFQDHWAMGDKWRKSRFNRAIHYTAPPRSCTASSPRGW